MARAYTFNLSSSSITALIKSLEYEKKRTFKTMSALCKVLTAEGQKTAKKQIDSLKAKDTGDLRRSIGKTVVPRITFIKGTIYADMPYGKYVEYGWGLSGEGSPHPDFNGNPWVYDLHGKGLKGFISRPFLYNTGQHIRNISTQRALEVFGKK